MKRARLRNGQTKRSPQGGQTTVEYILMCGVLVAATLGFKKLVVDRLMVDATTNMVADAQKDGVNGGSKHGDYYQASGIEVESGR